MYSVRTARGRRGAKLKYKKNQLNSKTFLRKKIIITFPFFNNPVNKNMLRKRNYLALNFERCWERRHSASFNPGFLSCLQRRDTHFCLHCLGCHGREKNKQKNDFLKKKRKNIKKLGCLLSEGKTFHGVDVHLPISVVRVVFG